MISIASKRRAGTRHQRRVHRDFYSQLRAQVLTTLSRLHDRSPLETLIRIQTLYSRFRFLDRELLEGIVERLLGESVLVGDGNAIALADFSPALTQAQQRLHGRVIEAFRKAGLKPPQATDLSREFGVGEEEVRPIIALCAGQGQLVHIGSSMYLHREWEAKLRASIVEQLRKGPGMTVSEIKERILPELDDEFAKSVGDDYKDLAELRERTQSDLTAEAENVADRGYRESAITALVEGATFELPELIVEHEMAHLEERQQRFLSSVNIRTDDYLTSIGSTEDEMRSNLRSDAEGRIKRSAALDEFARLEDVEVSDDLPAILERLGQ